MYFKKTPKGQAEIEGSTRQLPQSLRMALLLVDGKRSAAEVTGMLSGATTDTLRKLRDEGYIEATKAPSRSSSSGSSTPAPQAASDAPDSVFKASVMPSRFDIAARAGDDVATDKERAQVERSITRALGPAGSGLAERARAARSVGDLVEVVKSAQRAIANARGKEIADEFASRYAGLDDN